jgi:hypothetical protein
VYHNDGNGQFSYGSLETGIGALSDGSSGWGVRLEDFDNNGWKELFVAQSHVMDNVEQIDPSLRYRELPFLALNHDGRFERASSGSASAVAGRGAAFGDLNNDGGEHWLTISLRGSVAQANVEALWPPGTRQTLRSVSADKLLEIREPEHP